MIPCKQTIPSQSGAGFTLIQLNWRDHYESADNQKYFACCGDNTSDLIGSGWILGPALSASEATYQILLRHHYALKSTVAVIVCKSSLAVASFLSLHKTSDINDKGSLCQDICISASVEYYRLMFCFLTSFSQHVRALIHWLHKVMMLQWPGDCELSQAISCDGALVSAQTCSFGLTLLATVLSFKQAGNVWIGPLSLQAES